MQHMNVWNQNWSRFQTKSQNNVLANIVQQRNAEPYKSSETIAQWEWWDVDTDYGNV